MSDEEIKAELERLRQENAALKKRGYRRYSHESKRKGSGVDLRHGPLPRDLI